jgi:hypothetical protein
MPAADLSGDRVAERLGALEDGYDSFPVNQTTLSVSPQAYERARERCETGLADVYIQVYRDSDVLLVEHDEEWVVPHVEPPRGDPLGPATRQAVADDYGVQCTITDLERATILGVRHEDDPDREPVYRLVAVFAAEHVAGTPDEGAAWHEGVPESALPTY